MCLCAAAPLSTTFSIAIPLPAPATAPPRFLCAIKRHKKCYPNELRSLLSATEKKKHVPQDELLVSSNTTLDLGLCVCLSLSRSMCVCVCVAATSVRAKWKLQVPIRFAVLLAAAKGHATAQTAAKYHQTVQTQMRFVWGPGCCCCWPPVLVELWSGFESVWKLRTSACLSEEEEGGGGVCGRQRGIPNIHTRILFGSIDFVKRMCLLLGSGLGARLKRLAFNFNLTSTCQCCPSSALCPHLPLSLGLSRSFLLYLYACNLPSEA